MVAGESASRPTRTVALTTLELNPAGTVEQAVDVLIELIEGRPPAARLRLIPTRLVERASTRRVG